MLTVREPQELTTTEHGATMNKLQETLKIAFASEFSFYLKAHYFHWNVEGPRFHSLHNLFGDIYEEVHESVDVFAEQIRASGTYTPGSLQRFTMLTQIDDETGVPNADAMVAMLLDDAEKMAKIYQTLFRMSEEAGEYGLSDFLGARMDAYKKHAWMLRATAKTEL
jgi:starvation-inducible DNA-binding protein